MSAFIVSAATIACVVENIRGTREDGKKLGRQLAKLNEDAVAFRY